MEDVEPDSFSAALAAGELVASPIDLGLGDLYFFKSDAVHQVPWFAGRCACVRSVACLFNLSPAQSMLSPKPERARAEGCRLSHRVV